jgi:hypothetical protein
VEAWLYAAAQAAAAAAARYMVQSNIGALAQQQRQAVDGPCSCALTIYQTALFALRETQQPHIGPCLVVCAGALLMTPGAVLSLFFAAAQVCV